MIQSAIQPTLYCAVSVSQPIRTPLFCIFLILYHQCFMDFYESRALFHRARLIQWGLRTPFSKDSRSDTARTSVLLFLVSVMRLRSSREGGAYTVQCRTDEIAYETGLSVRQVQRVLQWFCEQGYISLPQRGYISMIKTTFPDPDAGCCIDP